MRHHNSLTPIFGPNTPRPVGNMLSNFTFLGPTKRSQNAGTLSPVFRRGYNIIVGTNLGGILRLLHLHQVADLIDHAANSRAVLVYHCMREPPQPQSADDLPLPLVAADVALLPGYLKLRQVSPAFFRRFDPIITRPLRSFRTLSPCYLHLRIPELSQGFQGRVYHVDTVAGAQ